MTLKLVDKQGNTISSEQATYKDIWEIFMSIGQMNRAMAYFTRKERMKFMQLNGIRIKSIQAKLHELRMEHLKKETKEDGKEYFVQENGQLVYKSESDESEFKRKWQEYLSFPVEIKE